MLNAFIIYPQLPISYTFTVMPPPVSLTYSDLPSFLKIPSNFQSPTATPVSGNALLSAVTILDSTPLSFPTAALTAIAAPSDTFPFPASPASDPSASQSAAPCPPDYRYVHPYNTTAVECADSKSILLVFAVLAVFISVPVGVWAIGKGCIWVLYKMRIGRARGGKRLVGLDG
jgi:hypothetical protein